MTRSWKKNLRPAMGIVLAIDFIELDSKNIIGNMKKILTKQKQSMKYWREWTQERLPLKTLSDQADKKTYVKVRMLGEEEKQKGLMLRCEEKSH